MSSRQFRSLLTWFAVLTFGAGLLGLVVITTAGYIAPWSGRFYSLWDTGYAKIHIPIIASVSEHQPTAWPAFFFDLNMLIWLFPAGVYLCFQDLADEHVFIVVYALSGSYFAGVMVRLMLTLTPVVCVARRPLRFLRCWMHTSTSTARIPRRLRPRMDPTPRARRELEVA